MSVWRVRAWLLVVWALVYGTWTLGSPPLMDDADSVHAEVAREMLVRHDYVTLYANGIRYLEKAPLLYWSMAASMRVFGVGTAQSRLPLALAVLLLALVCAALGRRLALAQDLTPDLMPDLAQNLMPDLAGAGVQALARADGESAEWAALFAGLMLLASFGFFVFGRINLPDGMVCVLLAFAILCFWRTEGPGHSDTVPARRDCWGFAAACALNVLTKGLIGVVFPVLIVAVYLVLTRGGRGAWRRVQQLRVPTSLLVFLLLAVPWHVLAGLANPGHGAPGVLHRVLTPGGELHWEVPLPTDGNVHGWTWFYFINEQVYRYLNVRVPHDYDTAPLWLFLGLVLVWIMPWSAFLPGAFRWALARRWLSRLRRRELGERERLAVLLAVFAAVPLLFFSLSTRQEYYVLPSLVPLVVVTAGWLGVLTRRGEQTQAAGRPGKRRAGAPVPTPGEEGMGGAGMGGAGMGAAWLLAGAGAAVALGCGWFLLHTRAPAAGTDLSSLLGQNPGDYALSMGHFLDLNGQALGLFRGPLLVTALAIFGGATAHLLLRRAERGRAAVLALLLGTFGFLGAVHWGRVIFSPVLSSEALAEAISRQVRPEDMVAIHGEYEAGSSLGFYLRRNDLHIVEGRSSNLWYGSFFPDAPRIFESRESMEAKWAGPQRIFLWQDPSDPERPPLRLPGPVYLLARSGGHELLSNRPALPAAVPAQPGRSCGPAN